MCVCVQCRMPVKPWGGHQIPGGWSCRWLWASMCVENWTLVLLKSSRCSQLRSHFHNPAGIFKKGQLYFWSNRWEPPIPSMAMGLARASQVSIPSEVSTNRILIPSLPHSYIWYLDAGIKYLVMTRNTHFLITVLLPPSVILFEFQY